LIKKFCWYYTENCYFATHTDNGLILFHRFVLGINSENINVGDHKNGNKYDNRKENLRDCTWSQNSMNKEIQKNNTSGVVGVSFFKQYEQWRAYITVNKKQIHLGYFDNFIDAVTIRKRAEKIYFEEFSYDNSRGINNEK
jgi:hypothetical protein